MRSRYSITRGSLVVSTRSRSSQVAIVNKYGSQIVYCSRMTHGPFSSLRSIRSKHSVIVAGTLRFIAAIAAAASAHRSNPYYWAAFVVFGIARLDEWGFAGLVGDRLSAVERGLRAAL